MKLGNGTGFLLDRGGSVYVMTNWHIVTGRRPDTKAVLSPTGAVPDRLRIFFNKHGHLGMCVEKTERLYDDEQPRWLEHPTHTGGARCRRPSGD
jgi:hypothetical protein